MSRYKKVISKYSIILVMLLGLVVGMLQCEHYCIRATAMESAEDMAIYAGVTVSPDKTAWTTDYMDRTNESLPEKYTIVTGQGSSLRNLEKGEHYYKAAAEGSIRIGKWVVAWKDAQCIHYYGAQNYKGFQIKEGICERYYNNGWNAYCADCNEVVADLLFYAKSDTVKGILTIPAKSCYLYICPHCEGLEQGTEYQHMCKEISYNRYDIVYEKNAPGGAKVIGYMPASRHMYDNANLYEGEDASELGYADKCLRTNVYATTGYIFSGWNTVPDGSGQSFTDGQEVLNLTEENNGKVILYAQWERAKSSLHINPGEGAYNDKTGITIVFGVYGDKYTLDRAKVTPPTGQTVLFEANGGECIDSLKTQKSFYTWQKGNDFQGDLKENVYTYTAQDGHIDSITAIYQDDSFILPIATKTGYVLAGWYADKEYTEWVGHPGEKVTTDCDITLYAQWSELVLTAQNNYEAYGGSGAVDLSWTQPGEEKYYKLYQSRDKSNWAMIYDADDITNNVTKVEKFIDYNSVMKSYTVQQTGYYTLSAFGAKGGDYEEFLGGAGGYTTATYWLKKGDVISVYGGTAGLGINGGVNDSVASGGNSKSEEGAGGGAATEIYITRNGTRELLMIAGGGGGANSSYAGGAGGESLTAIGNLTGTGSVFGGGGGGAQGGTANGSKTVTTIDNPAIEDIAFMSHVSKTYRDYSDYAIAGHMENKKAGGLVYQTLIDDDAPWLGDAVHVIGSLNRPIDITDADYVSDEYHYATSKNTMASIDKAPYYYCLQAGGGFTRVFTATYPTNGNTNLVLSASQKTPWHAINGYIEFVVTDADTGKELDAKRIVEANAKWAEIRNNDGKITASGNHLYAGCWTDLAIPKGVENVTVTARIFIKAWDAHTNAYLTDTFFYGKEIVSVGPNTGGSSYINTGYGCKNQSFEAGKNNGMGYGTITGTIEAVLEQTSLQNVRARDVEAPDKISLNKENLRVLDDDIIEVVWAEPEDKGTVYYHRCESYYNGEKQLDSNITKNTIISGVKGYYYCIDSYSEGKATASDTYVESVAQKGCISVKLEDEEKYLHVAAVDVAGNLGDTANIELQLGENSSSEHIKLFTEQMSLQDTEFTYEVSKNCWYVKADGMTEHTLNIGAGLDEATIDLQINGLRVCVGNVEENEWIQTSIPYSNPSFNTESFWNGELSMSVSEKLEDFLQPGTAVAKRTNHGARVELAQRFSVNSDVADIYVYPKAVAEVNNKTYYSDGAQDVLHGLTIIPDGEAPTILGLSELQELKVVDITEQSRQVTLWAEDKKSGLQEFVLTVKNKDNHMKAEFLSDGEGKIQVDICKENPLFMGEVTFSVLAVDLVGNANIIGEEGLSFTLETELYKERNPEEVVFKTGDGAVLDIATSGYVERIEVIFPEVLLGVEPDLNCVFEYEYPAIRKTESLKFHIPLGIVEQEYEVVVKAYKNGRVLISKPTLVVVEGSVLDELRTRIRNNG